jgi:hypothetical protein
MYEIEARSQKNGASMNNSINIVENQQVLERLARQGSEANPETSVVISPGARAAAWTARVKSHSSYNVYNVRAVEIGGAGSIPVEIGGEVQAVNVAESFFEDGRLSAGACVIMFRVGEKYVFYAPV